MFKRNHVCAIAAMAAFSMMSFIACGDDVVNTPNPSTEPVADEPSADSVSTKGPSAEEIQKNCQREGLNELCLVVSSPGKVEYFQSGMDINDALKEKMSNHFAGTDISIYVSVDSAGDSWTEKQCNAQNEYKFSRLGYYYRNERFLKHLSLQCFNEGRWENVKDVSDRCSENPELGDICDLGTFCIQNAHSCTPLDDRNVYTSLGWISLPTYYGPIPTKGLLNPVTHFLTLVLDSDTDHPKYKYARYVYEGACADRKGGVCVEEWGWDGCDVDRGQNCVEIFRIYIKSNGEFDEERSFFSTEQKVNKLKKPITETCDAASGGKLATVVDSLVFPNGQVFKQELQYQCDSESEKWYGVKQDVSACEKPDAKVGDVCPITYSGHVSLGGPYRLICYVYTGNGWVEKGSDDWYALGQKSSCEEIMNAPKIETECSWHDMQKKTVDGVTYSYICENREWLVWDVQRIE